MQRIDAQTNKERPHIKRIKGKGINYENKKKENNIEISQREWQGVKKKKRN